jgi:hypothetical protein
VATENAVDLAAAPELSPNNHDRPSGGTNGHSSDRRSLFSSGEGAGRIENDRRSCCLRAELAQGLGDRLGPAVTMATTEHFNRCTGGTTCARETLTSLRRSIGSPPSSQVLTRPRMGPPLVLSEATLVREAGRSDGSRDDPDPSAAAGPRSRRAGCATSTSVSTVPPPVPAAPTPASARRTCRS